MKLPDFSDNRLTKLLVCCHFDLSDEIREYVKDGSFDNDAQYNDLHWLHLIVDVSKKEEDIVHFHVDVINDWQDKPSPASVTIDDLLEKASKFVGQEGPTWIRGNFELQEEGLPKGDLVRPFLGIPPITFGSEKLVIDGMHMHVEGGEFDEISWQKKEDGILSVQIDAVTEKRQISDNLLIDSVAELRSGLDRFLLGSRNGNEQTNDS